MPFAKEFDDVYAVMKSAIQSSVPGEKVDCFRMDEITSAGRITDDMIKELRESTICVADITSNNPNVMWEVGYAMALQKPVLFIAQDLATQPFDIRDMRKIQYDRNSIQRTLYEKLGQAFRETLGKYEIRREATKIDLYKALSPRIIAITGSSYGNKAKCERRVRGILKPYLEDNITWLCGSSGLVDECILELLIQHKSDTMVVGYHSYDVSPRVLELIQSAEIPFIDAQKEKTPKGIAAPTERDAFFLTKSDMMIFFWDGKSEGTRKLIEFSAKQEKDYIVGFI
jgi:hypothetical protein